MFVNLPKQETSEVYRVFRDNKGTQKRGFLGQIKRSIERRPSYTS
jgi:hypothetical protein